MPQPMHLKVNRLSNFGVSINRRYLCLKGSNQSWELPLRK